MKKTTFLLVAFMLLGLVAKAQLVTTYDVTFQREYSRPGGFNVLEFQNTNSKIRIRANIPQDKRDRALRFHFSVVINEDFIILDNPIINSGLSGAAYKIGNRTHVISWNEKNNKCLYGFFDDQPDTKDGQPNSIDEFNEIVRQKGIF